MTHAPIRHLVHVPQVIPQRVWLVEHLPAVVAVHVLPVAAYWIPLALVRHAQDGLGELPHHDGPPLALDVLYGGRGRGSEDEAVFSTNQQV